MRFSEDRLATLECAAGVERTIHIWEPAAPRAIVLALHGGMAHAGDYVTPARYFRDHGIATISYDMCGHDQAKRVDIPGFDIFLDESTLLLQWIKRAWPGVPVFVMGHSMGGLIATHLGLQRWQDDAAIKGYILSSPYYVNAIKVSPVLLALSGVLAALASQTHLLTHDGAITKRHYADERDHTRATEVTVRFGHALTQAQAGLAAQMPAWRHPMFAVVAGDDKLADSEAGTAMLRSIAPHLLEYHHYPHNYHENFNEVNRQRIFDDALCWMAAR